MVMKYVAPAIGRNIPPCPEGLDCAIWRLRWRADLTSAQMTALMRDARLSFIMADVRRQVLKSVLYKQAIKGKKLGEQSKIYRAYQEVVLNSDPDLKAEFLSLGGQNSYPIFSELSKPDPGWECPNCGCKGPVATGTNNTTRTV